MLHLDTLPTELIIQILQLTNLKSLAFFCGNSSRLRRIIKDKQNVREICNAMIKNLVFALKAQQVSVTRTTSSGWCFAALPFLKAREDIYVPPRSESNGGDEYWPRCGPLISCYASTPGFLFFLENESAAIRFYAELLRRFYALYRRLDTFIHPVANGFPLDPRKAARLPDLRTSICNDIIACDHWFLEFSVVEAGRDSGMPFPRARELMWFFGVPNEEERKDEMTYRPEGSVIYKRYKRYIAAYYALEQAYSAV